MWILWKNPIRETLFIITRLTPALIVTTKNDNLFVIEPEYLYSNFAYDTVTIESTF